MERMHVVHVMSPVSHLAHTQRGVRERRGRCRRYLGTMTGGRASQRGRGRTYPYRQSAEDLSSCWHSDTVVMMVSSRLKRQIPRRPYILDAHSASTAPWCLKVIIVLFYATLATTWALKSHITLIRLITLYCF